MHSSGDYNVLVHVHDAENLKLKIKLFSKEIDMHHIDINADL